MLYAILSGIGYNGFFIFTIQLPDMKKPLLIISSILFFIVQSKAQSNSDYLEHHWYGYYEEPSDLFENNKYTMVYEMYDVVYDDIYNTFSATMYGSINIDGSVYGSTWKINGSMDGNYNVYLNYNYTINSDPLPDDLYWIYDNLSGTLYSDETHPGEYVIKGYKSSTGGTLEIVTYKSY